MSKKIIAIFFSFIFLLSCSHKNVKVKQEVPIKKPARVYIPPFKYFKNPNNLSNLSFSVDKNIIKYSYKNELMDLIVKDLAEKFCLKIKNYRKDYKPVSIEQVENVFELPVNKVPLNQIIKRFNIDYIIQGYIIKFIEREGNSFSVRVPAEVYFVITIIDPKSHQVVWKESYHEKQESLSSNLLYFYKFFKRKGKWLTALELTESAFNKLVKDLP